MKLIEFRLKESLGKGNADLESFEGGSSDEKSGLRIYSSSLWNINALPRDSQNAVHTNFELMKLYQQALN